MKIVHIAYTRYGGAGRAAFRLHEAMLKKGINSIFLSLDKNDALLSCYCLGGELSSSFNVKRQLINFRNFRIIYPFKKIVKRLNCEAASLPFSGFRLLENSHTREADIINLHWVSGLIDYPSFFANNNRPVIWTMHDMQPFSGIFHYENDLDQNISAWKIDHVVRSIKQNSIRTRKCQLLLVSPSKWLLDKALSGDVFRGLTGTVIPYSLDLELFDISDKRAARQKLGIDPGQKLILFISKHLTVKRKGLSLLLKALEKMAAEFANISLALIGNDEPHLTCKNVDIMKPGSVANDTDLVNWYAASDIVVIPSLEDNLPNVMLEALACGRPVLSLKNGGMAEHIIQNKTGWLCDEAGLAEQLINSLQTHDQFNAENIRQYAVANFSGEKQVSSYLEIYRQILQQ